MIYYRADLLNNAEHQAGFQDASSVTTCPAPPTTWKQYLDIATLLQWQDG